MLFPETTTLCIVACIASTGTLAFLRLQEEAEAAEAEEAPEGESYEA